MGHARDPLHWALIELCFERGLDRVTVDMLCRRAGIERSAFEARYIDIEDCFFAAYSAEFSRYRAEAEAARAGIDSWRDRLRATAHALLGFLAEDERVTHFTVVDAEGNAVAVTYTLNGGYGNGITVPGLGLLLNNEMDDFTTKAGAQNLFGLVQGEANAIQPDKRPVSSMAPTIILRDGKLFMTLGAPGGSRIPTAILQVFLNVVDFGMNLQDAVDAPRIHHQWLPDKLSLERLISPDTVALLKSMGHDPDYAAPIVGPSVEAILNDGVWLQGASDERRLGGKAAGY